MFNASHGYYKPTFDIFIISWNQTLLSTIQSNRVQNIINNQNERLLACLRAYS